MSKALKMWLENVTLFFWLVVLTVPVRGAVTPNILFGDNAVLQQDVNVPVWGTARDSEGRDSGIPESKEIRHDQGRQMDGSFQKIKSGRAIHHDRLRR